MRNTNAKQNGIPKTLHQALRMGFQLQWQMNCRLVCETEERS